MANRSDQGDGETEIPGANGASPGFAGREEMEEALRRSEANVARILESIHDAFYSLDRGWRFTYVNRRTCEIWNKRRDELLGKNIWEIFPAGRGTEAYVRMQHVMDNRMEEDFETFSRYLGIWTHIRTYPTDDGIAVYFHDITDRKKAEESLRRSEQIYHAIGETIDWGIWTCDPDGRNTYASPSFLRMVGMTQEECSEFGWGNVLHPDDAEETIAAWKACSQTGSFWERTHRFKGVDGRYHYVLARGIPVRDEQGTILCWAGINLDVDEMMKHEEEIRRLNEDLERRVEQRTRELMDANQELESFSYSVSHDLKAPLRVISGFARLLIEGHHDQVNEKTREYLGLILENTGRMNGLVDALLAFSRVTRQIPHVVQVDVRMLVEGVVRDELQALSPGPVCPISIEIGDLPSVMADPILLRQVFANLLSNALKFTRGVASPRIVVGAVTEPEAVVYFVRDNGVGFRSADAKKLFHVFQRLHGQGEFEGSGVGLANVRKIIERHGGRVWAEGEEGKGAAFFIALPRAQEQRFHEHPSYFPTI